MDDICFAIVIIAVLLLLYFLAMSEGMIANRIVRDDPQDKLAEKTILFPW